MKNNIIFIGGTGRCGTNILRKILGLHPDVASLPFEYRFIIDPDGLVDYYSQTTWSPYMIDRRLKRLEALFERLSTVGTYPDDKYADWELDKHIPGFMQLATKLLSDLVDFTHGGGWIGSTDSIMRYSSPRPKEVLKEIIGGFIKKVINSILVKQDKKIYVEDNTWNILFAKELLGLVPDAKLIHIYRDPRDVVASFVKQSWCPSDPIKATAMYKDIMNHWLEIREELNKDSYCEIKFEYLIEKTGAALLDLCNFIGIPFNSQMTDIDLSNHNIGRWEKDFTKNEQKIIQEELSEIMYRYYYERVS